MTQNEHTAVDTEIMDLVQPAEVVEMNAVDAPAEVTEPENTAKVTTEEVSTEPAVIEYDIEGVGKLTLAEIKELKQSGLRQSDYTRKTQELAKQREEQAEAMELYEYMRANPQLVSTLQAIEGGNINPVMNKPNSDNALLKEVYYNQKSMEIDNKLNSLKSQYGEIDEVALFNKATELKTDDLEFVYKALKYDGQTVDRQTLIEEAKAQIMADIASNKIKTATMVSTNSATNNFNKTTASLSPEETRVAEQMGMTPSEYLKWK